MITILVVEDDTKLNFIVSKKLGEEGFEVKRAENPIQAFDIMEKTKVDMIVSDIMMPQMRWMAMSLPEKCGLLMTRCPSFS